MRYAAISLYLCPKKPYFRKALIIISSTLDDEKQLDFKWKYPCFIFYQRNKKNKPTENKIQ